MLAYLTGDPHNHPELAVEEDFDPLLFAIENGEIEEAAAHAQAGEVYRKSLLALSPAAQLLLAHHLESRLRLIDDGSYWLFGDDAPPDEDPPGPVPVSELDERATDPQCRFCGQAASGPPAPYCCEDRKRRALKIDAGEHPAFPGPANDQDQDSED